MPARDPFASSDLPQLFRTLQTFSLRDQALVTTGMNTGFRGSELGALLISHIREEDGSIRDKVALERRHLKHGSGVYRHKIRSRVVPLTAPVREILGRYLAERTEQGTAGDDAPLFLSRKRTPLSIWQINRIVHALALRAGCATDRFYGSHSMRKSFAHAVHAACNRDISMTRVALAHSSVVVTQRYLSVEERDVHAAILSIGAQLSAA